MLAILSLFGSFKSGILFRNPPCDGAGQLLTKCTILEVTLKAQAQAIAAEVNLSTGDAGEPALSEPLPSFV